MAIIASYTHLLAPALDNVAILCIKTHCITAGDIICFDFAPSKQYASNELMITDYSSIALFTTS
jgi:hypothetical protein